MTPELDLNALRLIVHLGEEGSLGAAGRALGVSQPAASATLRAFEARWRLTVATRSARGTRLTQDGETVAAWGRDLLHQVDTIRGGLTALSQQRAQSDTTLTIAASLTVAEFVLPRWLGELRTALPEVHPSLSVVNSDVVDTMIHSGDCEIGFVETTDVSRDLAHKVVGHDRLVIVVNPAHPWARRSTPLSRDQLLASEFVLREGGSGTRHTFERALAAKPDVAMVATSTTAMVGAALAGIAPAVVSPRAVGSAVDNGQLVIVEHDLDLKRPLTAVWQRDAALSPAALALLRIASRNRP